MRSLWKKSAAWARKFELPNSEPQNRAQAQLKMLQDFWDRFEKEPEHRLKFLKEMAELDLGKRPRKQIRLVRKQFRKRHIYLGGKCATCPNLATVRHHIIQLQYGGRNRRYNIILICDDCHAIIHPWLQKQATTV